MLFFLKKFVSFWIMPLPFCLTVLVIGLVLAWGTRWKRLGRGLVIFAVVFLMVVSNHFVSRALMRPLETRYAPIPELLGRKSAPPELARCGYVVVLGGGNGFTPNMAATSQLSRSALARITEAVRLLRAIPEAKLIVSGPSDGKRTAHAVVLARAAMSLGVDERKIVLIERALDTEDEARLVGEHVGRAPFALVTSAWHMPRAIALFRAHGMSPLPAPADFITHADDSFFFGQLLWDERALACSTLAVRERIGYLWIWLRGKTTPAPEKSFAIVTRPAN